MLIDKTFSVTYISKGICLLESKIEFELEPEKIKQKLLSDINSHKHLSQDIDRICIKILIKCYLSSVLALFSWILRALLSAEIIVDRVFIKALESNFIAIKLHSESIPLDLEGLIYRENAQNLLLELCVTSPTILQKFLENPTFTIWVERLSKFLNRIYYKALSENTVLSIADKLADKLNAKILRIFAEFSCEQPILVGQQRFMEYDLVLEINNEIVLIEVTQYSSQVFETILDFISSCQDFLRDELTKKLRNILTWSISSGIIPKKIIIMVFIPLLNNDAEIYDAEEIVEILELSEEDSKMFSFLKSESCDLLLAVGSDLEKIVMKVKERFS